METPVNAPIKEKIRIEFAKLREMTFKNKLDYIWEYYKFHIVCITIVLFIIFSMLNLWIFNPRPDTVLFISWNGGFATEDQLKSLKDSLEERLIPEGENEEVVIAQFFLSSDDPAMNMAELQRTAAMLAAGTIDFFIVNSELLEQYSRFGYFMPLENVLTIIQSKNPEAYRRIEENVVTADFEIEEGVRENLSAGIKIGNSPLFLKHGLYRQDIYISIAATTNQLDNIIEALILFFE